MGYLRVHDKVDPTFVHWLNGCRGKCSVRTYRSLSELDAEHFTPDDAFFAYLCFNLDNSRLTAIHGTSRVGPRHQATLPPEPIADISEERDRDELLYQPTDLCPDVENEYIQRCRTHRTIRLLQLPNLTQLERDSRLGDLCMDDAITELHFSGYNVKKAQETMQRRDALLVKEEAMGSFLSSDDVKKFTKGIKTYGKNFARIQKELLPYHMREHLVTFYYMWKKSRDAARPRYFPRSRVVPKKPKNSTKASPVADFNDYPSASESDSEIEERACHHCYTTKSKNWHHAGAQKQLLCTECRLHFKKYGRMREVGERPPVPECLSRISPVDFEGGVRTRACKSSRQKNSRDRAVDSPLGDDKSSRKTRKRIQRSVDNSFTSRECTPSKMARTIPEEEVEKPIINGYTSGNSAASSPVETKDELMSCERPATNGVDPKPNTDVKPITNGISPVVPESNEVSKIKVNKVDSKPFVYSAVKLTIKHKTMSLDEIPTTSVTVKSVVPVVVKDEKENVIKIDLKEEINEGEDCFLSNEQVALLRTFYSMARVHQVSEVLPYEPGSFQRLTFVESDGQKISIFAPAVLERRIRCETGVTCARTDLVYLAEKNNQAWLQRREACRVQRQNQQKQRQNELEQQHAAAAQKAQQQAQQQMRTMSAKSQPVFSTASSSAMPTQSVIPPSSGIPGFDLNMMNGLNPTEIMLRAALAQQHQQMLLANPHMQVINMIEQQKHQEALRRQQQEQQQRMLEEQRQAQVAQQAQMAAVAAAQQQQMRLKAGLMSGMNPQALPGLMHPAMMQQAIMQQMLQQQAQIQQQQQVQIQQQQQVQMQQQQQAQMQQQQQAQIQQQQHAAVLQAEEQRKQQQRLKESQQQQQQQHQQQQRLVAARAQELQQQQQFAAAMQAQFQLQQQQQQQQQNSASNALQHFANMLHSQGINPNASAADNMAMMMMAAANQQANQQFTADQIAESYRKMAELTRTA